MLTDREKSEMKEAAASAAIRSDFERIERRGRPGVAGNLDRFMKFLADFNRMFPMKRRRRTEADRYGRVLI